MRYIWIIMLLLAYIIWGLIGVKEYMDNLKTYKDKSPESLFDCLMESDVFTAWGWFTIFILFIVSLGSFIFSALKGA